MHLISILHLNIINYFLQYLLKHEEWQCLREVPRYPSSICPSHPNTQDVIWEMVKQVIDFHSDNSDLEYLHIGADEVKQVKCLRDMFVTCSFHKVFLYSALPGLAFRIM